MDERDLQLASLFCRQVESADLLEYLGVPRDATAQQAQAALEQRRRHMQSMQNNPKYRDSARTLMKHFRAFQRVLEEPEEHLEFQRREREEARLPMLCFAIDSILVDGVISAVEEAFVRKTAAELEISMERYEQVLAERALAAGVPLPTGTMHDHGPRQAHQAATERQLRGAQGHAWWDAHFTRRLLESIPGGPGELVDIYCRAGLAAYTLLPERPQVSYLGIDRSEQRLETARQATADDADRVRFVRSQPVRLPVEDQSADYALAIRALANLPDTRRALAEVRRILRPGGRLIAVEPDGLAESFYFHGHLVDYNAAFHRLCQVVDSTQAATGAAGGRPGLSLGPQLLGRMSDAGFRPTSTVVHAAYNLKVRSFASMAKRLRQYPLALARSAGLPGSVPEVRAVLDEVTRLEAQHSPTVEGLGGNSLPLFLCTGVLD